MKNLIREIIVALLTILFGAILSKWTEPKYYFIIVLGALLLYAIIDYIIFRSPLIYFFRKKLYSYSELEGFWLQKLGSKETMWDRPWSVSFIRANKLRHGWEYCGTGYDRNLLKKATWESKDIKFDAKRQAWIFYGKSERYIDSEADPVSEGRVLSILNWKAYKFRKAFGDRRCFSGRLADMNFDNEPGATDIIFTEIKEKDWKEIGVDNPQTELNQNQLRQLINIVTT